MATFTNELLLSRPPHEVFDFLRTTANRLKLLPADGALELIEGPPVLAVGARTTLKLSRFGMSQTIVMEVTACEAPTRLVEEQRQGPLKRWVQTMTCEPHESGMRLRDVIDFEPPGGMLGFIVTAAKISEMLLETFAARDRQLRVLLK